MIKSQIFLHCGLPEDIMYASFHGPYIVQGKGGNMCQLAPSGPQDMSVPASRTYRVEEIAELLGIGRRTAYNLVKEGHFKTVRIGKTIRISKKSFDMWLDEKR